MTWRCRQSGARPETSAGAGWVHMQRGIDVGAVSETPTRYRVEPAETERVRLAGKLRSIGPGESALVPRKAVTRRGE